MPKTPKPPAPTDGARRLLAHIRKLGVSIPDWCELKKLNRIQVQRAINGERTRTSVDFAVAVERATDGEVPVSSWHSKTKKPVSDARRAA